MATPSNPPRWAVSLFVTSIGLWAGAAVFLSAAVLPLLFTNMAPSDAGTVAALIFPVYFRAGLVAGVLACVAVAVLARRGSRRWQAAFALVVCMTLAQGWSALVVHPEMATIRGDEQYVERFQELHRLSVRLNAVVLGGALVLLLSSGALLTRREHEP